MLKQWYWVIFHLGLWLLHAWDIFLGDLLYILGSSIFSRWIRIGLIVTYCLPLIIIFVRHFVFCTRRKPKDNSTGPGQIMHSPVMRGINCLAVFCRVDQATADPSTVDATYVKVMTGMIFLVSEDMPQLVLQLLNNLLLGSQLTLIQCVTPITSLLMISYAVVVYLMWLCVDKDRTVCQILPYSLIPLPLIGFMFWGAWLCNWSV